MKTNIVMQRAIGHLYAEVSTGCPNRVLGWEPAQRTLASQNNKVRMNVIQLVER